LPGSAENWIDRRVSVANAAVSSSRVLVLGRSGDGHGRVGGVRRPDERRAARVGAAHRDDQVRRLLAQQGVEIEQGDVASLRHGRPGDVGGCRDGDDRAPGDRDDLAVAQHLEPEPPLGGQLLAVPRGARHRHRRERRQVGDGDPCARAAGDLDRRRVVEQDDVELDGLADLQDQRRAGDQAAVLAGLEAEGDLEGLVDHHHVGALGPGDVEAGVGLAGRLAVAEDGVVRVSAVVAAGRLGHRHLGRAPPAVRRAGRQLGAHGGDLGEHLAEAGSAPTSSSAARSRSGVARATARTSAPRRASSAGSAAATVSRAASG
jgi:hypothetical protein